MSRLTKLGIAAVAALTFLTLSNQASAAPTKLSVRPYASFKAGASLLNLDSRCNDSHLYDNSNSVSKDYIWDCSVDHKTAFSMRPAIGLEFYDDSLVGIRTEVEWYQNNRQKFTGKSKGIITNLDGSPNTTYYAELNNKIQTKALMFNTYADFHTDRIFVPYVGAGLGWAKHSNKHSNIVPDVTITGDDWILGHPGYTVSGKTNTNRLAVDVAAGTAIKFNDYIALDLGATYYYFGSVKNPNILNKLVLSSVNFDAGLRLTF